MKLSTIILFLIIFGLLAGMSGASHANSADATIKSAVLAGGCFWCLESDFDKLSGVISTTSGYAGGTIENPTYETYHDAGADITPHIEVVKVEYDSKKISYPEILDYFLRHIDATDGGGQFCDRGPSYRPAVFVKDEEERKQANVALKKATAVLDQTLAVEVLPDAPFWPAEEYHQNYHTKNSTKYSFYRWKCGRDQRVEELWGSKK